MTDVAIVHGVEFQMGWRVKLSASTPKPLNGANVLVQIRPTKGSTTVIASYDRLSPYLTIVDASGSIDLNLPPSITSSFTFTKAVIDCWVYDNVDTDGDRSPTSTLIYDTGVARL